MDARPLRMLSGEEIVAKGRNVTNCILPEVGTKEVTPNGTWLETKQIQTALEARKALVAAERIDKVGALSHAEWRDLLKLAEVTQQVGGHWQYIGHNVNGTFYLLPEEALYLIETNCLLLKHNDVTVSLQKAYNLLLDDKMTLKQYKVYASLSRVGYKVFRHEKLNQACQESKSLVKDKIVAEMDTNLNMQLLLKDSFTKSESKELDQPQPANANALTKSSILDPPITLDEESPKATTMSSEPPIAPEETVKSIDNDKTSSISPSLPINDTTELVNKVTTLSPNLPSPKNHSLPPNGDVTSEESPRSLSADNNTLNNEPGVSSDKLSLPPDINVSLDPTIYNDKTSKTGLEMSSDPVFKDPLLPSDNNTSNVGPKLASDPTFSLDTNTLNENPEMSSNEPAIPAPLDCNDSNKDSIILSAVSSDEITSNKQCKMSSDQPPLPKSPPKDTSHGNRNLPNNETISIHGTGASIDSKVIFSIDKLGVVRLECTENSADIESEAVSSVTSNFQSTKSDKTTNTNIPRHMLNSYKVNQNKLLNRKIKPSDAKSMHDKFKDIPDFHNQQIVTVNVPSEDYLPRNVYLNKSSYELKAINFTTRPKSTPTSRNSAMYRTIKNSSESEEAAVPTTDIPQLLSNTPSYQQPYNFFPAWRPRFHPIQRPFFPQHRFNPHQFFFRMMHAIPPNFNEYRPQGPYRFNLNHRQRKRRRHLRDEHLRAVREVARRLKLSRAPNINVKQSLVELLARFNEIYNERMLVTPEFNIVEDTQNVETIELDDDEVQIKKPRLESATFDQYLAKVKEIAAQLKSLIRKNQPVSKQKRAFCNLLKNFNETFDAEFCLDDNGELIDKKLVILDSSDDDVVATDGIDTSKSKKRSSECDIDISKRKKIKVLRNPFSVLNKINEGASTSQAAIEIPVEGSTNLSKYFDTNWLRNEDDFGRATICSKMDARHLMNDSQLLFDFMDAPDAFQNWIDLKIAFCMNMEMSTFDHDLTAHSNLTMDNSRLKPILQEETAGDWAASLEKLRIIKTNTDVQETSLRIDFDVYNRDVQNFRKTDPPKPHFRVVCVDESSDFPSGAQVRALHSKHHDNVTIVFAVVGVGSINYLQINPTDLPIYVGND